MTCVSPGDITGQLIEGIAEDVPSLTPEVTAAAALETALQQEGDAANDVIFDADTDAELVIYVQVRENREFKLVL